MNTGYATKEEEQDPFVCSEKTAWRDRVRHGRYADDYQQDPRGYGKSKQAGYRETALSPDPHFEHKVDKRLAQREPDHPLLGPTMDKQSQRLARRELKEVINNKNLRLERNSKLYKELTQRI